MRRNSVALAFTILGFLLMFMTVQAQPPRRFSKEEIKSDLKYLRDTLEVVHYDLYAYTDKAVFDSMYRKIDSSIKDSLTAMQAYRLFQPYLSLARIGECIIFYPFGEYWGNYLRQGGTVFPLNLGFSRGKVHVKDNFSSESRIDKGDEIISFNGRPIKEFMKGVYDFMSGESEYYKNSYLEYDNVSRIYWFSYDKCDVFKLEIRKKDGREIKIQLPAISGWEFEGKLSKQYPSQNPPRRFRLVNDVAYLYPSEFVNNPGKYDEKSQATRWDNAEFCHFIDSAFTAFRKLKAKSLIIDLRNNLGGSNTFSDYMISYFASKPFSLCSKMEVRTSRITKEFWKNINIPSVEELKQAILSHENGSRFEVSMPENLPQPDSIRFKGDVYVLINRFSFSNTTSVASIIQDYRFGKLIGEETPDFVSFYGATQQFKLPNTQLEVTFPKALLIRPNGDSTPQSVVPDYQVDDNNEDGKDEMFEYALDLIRSKKESGTIKTENGSYITFPEMDRFLTSEMDSLGIPGMSIVIINDSKIVYHRALGVTKVETKEKVTDETLFDAGSMSKTPFAFLVMKMVEKGILNLDQPLYTYLPYPDIAYDNRYKLITARMVLCHTSGFVNWRFQNKDSRLDLKFTPGTSFGYSGEGYEYLANVVAHLNDIPKNGLQDLFEKEVAGPLGMRYAYYTWNDYLEKHRATGHVDGKIVISDWGTGARNPNFQAAYSLQTEAVSYANFLIAMIKGEGLKKTLFDDMLKDQVVFPTILLDKSAPKTDSSTWCLGIQKEHSEYGAEYLHGNNNWNFTGAFMFNRQQKFGYVFFTNCSKGMEFNKRLEAFLAGKDASGG